MVPRKVVAVSVETVAAPCRARVTAGAAVTVGNSCDFDWRTTARAAGVKRLTFAASSSAYGDSEVLPKVESMPTAAKSPYAANKIAAEALMTAYASSYGLDTASLRYFNIFGPRQSANNAYAAVIAAFAKSLLAVTAHVNQLFQRLPYFIVVKRGRAFRQVLLHGFLPRCNGSALDR